MLKYGIFLIVFLFANSLFAQEDINTKKGSLTLRYFKIIRTQVNGSNDTQLNKDFEFLQLFKKGQRYAPDEPSSFSSFEYTFLDKKLLPKTSLNLSGGIYRNHVKGDIFLNNEKEVHFGLGNSQVGISSTATVNYNLYKGIQIGYFLQLGTGFQFTRWERDNLEFNPSNWGIRGFGGVLNTGFQITSPKIWNRWSVSGFVVTNLTYSKFHDFEVESSVDQTISSYNEIHYTLRSKNIIASVGLTYDLLKRK